MISSRSPYLLKTAQRWSLPCFHTRVNVPVLGNRGFTSPAMRRFRQNKALSAKTQQNLPHKFKKMDNNTLLTVAALENHDARIEVLKRHIMDVDQCSREEATVVFHEIAAKNREGMALAALPFQVGLFAGVTASIASIPLVFDLTTTLWFNEHFVTTEVPGAEDLETGLEVGAWAWNWMEPPLGTLSFVLLCLQFSRSQMENLGIKPYTSTLKKRRGKKLAEAFPRYDARVIMDFSETDPLMKVGTM